MIKTNPNKNIIIFIFKIKKMIESQGPQQFLKTECFLTDMALQISGSKSNATRNIIPCRKSDTLDKGHEPRNTNRTIKLKATGPGVHLETGRYGRQTQKAHKENIIKAKQANHAQEGDCQVGIGHTKKEYLSIGMPAATSENCNVTFNPKTPIGHTNCCLL
jgi:hypothetical protein